MLGQQSLALCSILLSYSLSLAQPQYFYPGRAERSLFNSGPSGWISGWSSSPSFELPPRSNHITKDEVLALLAAWKTAEAKPEAPKPTPMPEPEPEAEPEPEPVPEPAEEPAAEPPPAPVPAGPAPNVPLTVSLPAFVPIQLSAMYTAPVPVGGGLSGFGLGPGFGVGAGAGAAGGGGAAGAVAATAAASGGDISRISRPLTQRNSGNIRFPIANPRSFASANYVAPRPRFYRTIISETSQPIGIDALPIPTFLANPVQVIPSNWH